MCNMRYLGREALATRQRYCKGSCHQARRRKMIEFCICSARRFKRFKQETERPAEYLHRAVVATP